MFLIESFSKGKWSKREKAIEGSMIWVTLACWYCWTNYPIKTFNTANLRIAYFLDRKGKSNSFFKSLCTGAQKAWWIASCCWTTHGERSKKKRSCTHLTLSIIEAYSNWRNWCQQSWQAMEGALSHEDCSSTHLLKERQIIPTVSSLAHGQQNWTTVWTTVFIHLEKVLYLYLSLSLEDWVARQSRTWNTVV